MKSRKKSPYSKFLALMLAVVMMVTLAPMTARAADGDEAASQQGTARETDDSMQYSKTVTLEDDGTYTINMEAWATGEVKTTSSQTPTDIVLVLDVSGSMDTKDFPGEESYNRFTGNTNRQAYNNRNNLYVRLDDGSYSKVTVTRAGNIFEYTFTYSAPGMESGSSAKNDGSIPSPYNNRLYTLSSQDITRITALQNAANAFIDATEEKNADIVNNDQKHRISIVKFAGENESEDIGNDTYWDSRNEYNYSQIVRNLTVVNEQNAGTLKSDINELRPVGSTAADKGLNRAEAALQSSGEGRNKVVVMFTDGEPNYYSGFDGGVAARTVNKAKELKDSGVTIYTISVMDGSNPSDISGNMNKYMNAVSSNYPNAAVTNWWGNESTDWDDCKLGIGSNQGYYKVASNSSELENIFGEISSSVGESSVDLTEAAVVRDVLADGFAFPADWDAETIKSHVKVQTADYLGNNRFDDTPEDFNATVDINKAKDTIEVSGFDYEENFVVDASADGQVQTSGKKLIITITGVEASDAAVTNASVPTNKDASGIYESKDAEEAFRTFEVPDTVLTSKSYVLDFGKPVDLKASDWKQDTITTLDGDGMNQFSSAADSLTETYGNVTKSGDTLIYQPTTTNWDGYDSFYVFGKTSDQTVTDASANSNGNLWSKVSVIPATSVYYEDDFGYTTSDDGTQTKQDGYTTIEYTGNWTTVSAGKDAGETQGSENTVYGTDAAYDGNLNYSDGSAHYAESGATAKFTFTGTGLDIYTRTTASSGQVIVQIKGQENEKIYTALVDNEFTSTGENGLYQIPTVSFQDVVRDTYEATITVLPDKEGNSTFYLDAIRVYNPMSEEDAVASEAYEQAEEANAVIKEVRDELLDAETFGTVSVGNIPETAGSVYIDKSNGSTTEIGVYEDLGPKNEVYLASGTGVAFNIGQAQYDKVLLGLKAPAGAASQVTVTDKTGKKDIDVNSATDMYYEITPDENGNVMIYNSGDAMIAVTKVRVTGVDDPQNFALMTTPALMSYVGSFDSLSYTEETIEPGTGEGDVDIDNPSVPETPSEPDSGDSGNSGHGTVIDTIVEAVNSLWDSIWNGFSSWLSRW